jgi:hypothetical protein
MEKHLFRKKKGQLDEHQALIEIERHHSVQDSRPNTIKPCKDHVRMNQTLLPTVLLFISDPNNVPQLCRALLDSVAQKTLIAESRIMHSKTGATTRSCKITNNWPEHVQS